MNWLKVHEKFSPKDQETVAILNSYFAMDKFENPIAWLRKGKDDDLLGTELYYDLFRLYREKMSRNEARQLEILNDWAAIGAPIDTIPNLAVWLTQNHSVDIALDLILGTVRSEIAKLPWSFDRDVIDFIYRRAKPEVVKSLALHHEWRTKPPMSGIRIELDGRWFYVPDQYAHQIVDEMAKVMYYKSDVLIHTFRTQFGEDW